MKKILFLSLILGIMALSNVNAQSAFTGAAFSPKVMKSATGWNADTVTSTTAHYLISTKITGTYRFINVAFKGLEISGTTAGTISLEASGDSTVWYPFYNATIQSDVTFSLADVTTDQTHRWELNNHSGDLWIRVKAVGISTPNVQVSAKYWAKN